VTRSSTRDNNQSGPAQVPSQGPPKVPPQLPPQLPLGDAAGELIERIGRQADRAAFAELFRLFAPRLKSYLMRQGCDFAVAEDLMQETMVMVWRRAASFDATRASAATWLFTIARNKRIDSLRRQRRPAIDLDDPALVADPAPSAEEPVLANERGRRLAEALATLPAEQAALIRLAYFDDRAQSEIAAETRLPLGTVKSRLRLALVKLRRALEEFE
jgi:RNA polymerase sigma factor (sigma-70 family)